MASNSINATAFASNAEKIAGASMLPAFIFSPAAVIVSGLGYLVLCEVLRFRRRNQRHAEYPYKTREDFSKMTVQHAWEIQRYVVAAEFPFTAEKALQFALFRTYGIPTISGLLVSTKNLADPKMAPRRYTDTEVLIQEFMGNPPSSERTNSAIGRMNYLHSLYQKAGKISNDDLLYTLSLFALEPKRWIDRHEWRTLTPMEVAALGTFWNSMGDAMGISYEDLPFHKNGLKDGIQWMEEIEEWSTQYEERCMVPKECNKQTADQTTAILLWDLPKSLFDFGTKAVSALMDDRLRKAMMYKDPPAHVNLLVYGMLGLRQFVLRHLMLPRPWFLRSRALYDQPNADGRFYLRYYVAEPWYVKNNLWNRFGPQGIMKSLLGLPVPRDQKYGQRGYILEEVGPINLQGKGVKEHHETRDRLMAQGRGGCPFAVSR